MSRDRWTEDRNLEINRTSHPWGAITLTPAQQQALKRLEARLEESPVHQPICLVGPFGSGKTTLARYWLAQHLQEPERGYLAFNRLLLKAIQQEESLDRLAGLPAKARLLLHIAAEDLLEAHFEEVDVLALDCVELLQPYHISPVALTAPYAARGYLVLICLPDDPESGFRFELRPGEAVVIPLGGDR
ncbi:MAG: hypothetical protein KatS3mg115_0697 [Candidatus Poribacteria bacterium]|nr:MAG: hypothetical protein KatS3mg115_0697 [Candidatus Poribacteria bacterium]